MKNPQRCDTDDALGFLEAIKVAFQYVKSLFTEHVDFILEFNNFTPKEHRITLSLLESEDASNPTEYHINDITFLFGINFLGTCLMSFPKH